ncbi:MAG: hypothetical protein E7231_10785 [Cellulosilyticum sp.]|nr:hypothetical protein [Cellulosilyticum sp.]
MIDKKMTFKYVPPNINFIVMPILMFTSYYVLSGYRIESKRSKWYKLFCVVSILLIGYTIMLMELSIHWVKKGVYPFGIQAYEVGPFVYRQILVNALIQMGIYLRVMFLGLKHQKGYGLLISFSLAGACIDMGYISFLFELSDITYYNTIRNNNILIIALSSIVITGIIELLRRKKWKQM